MNGSAVCACKIWLARFFCVLCAGVSTVLICVMVLTGCAGQESGRRRAQTLEDTPQLCTLQLCSPAGAVRDDRGAVAGAVVRIQTTDVFVRTDAKGRFAFEGISCDQEPKLTAWAPGYYITGGVPFQPGSKDVELLLIRHTEHDNPDYAWLPSEYHPGEGENQGCAECHSSDAAAPTGTRRASSPTTVCPPTGGT